jgi:prevent-host-death family protein
MATLTNSHSLSDFQRNARSFLKGVNDTKEPLLLTVNGKIQGVLLDPETYQQLEELQERERFIAALKEGLKDLDEGRVVSLETLETELKARYGF